MFIELKNASTASVALVNIITTIWLIVFLNLAISFTNNNILLHFNVLFRSDQFGYLTIIVVVLFYWIHCFILVFINIINNHACRRWCRSATTRFLAIVWTRRVLVCVEINSCIYFINTLTFGWNRLVHSQIFIYFVFVLSTIKLFFFLSTTSKPFSFQV